MLKLQVLSLHGVYFLGGERQETSIKYKAVLESSAGSMLRQDSEIDFGRLGKTFFMKNTVAAEEREY